MMQMRRRYQLLLAILVVLTGGLSPAWAQTVEISVGGGASFPTNNVNAEAVGASDGGSSSIDLKPGPHAYVGAGLVRSVGDHFSIGARLRAQVTQLRSSVGECDGPPCGTPDGLSRVLSAEGRIILTKPDWIRPYALVGLGVVSTTVEASTDAGGTSYEEVSVTDAGGNIGLGASLPLFSGLFADVEVRIAGTLPGGKNNAVDEVPVTAGVSYRF